MKVLKEGKYTGERALYMAKDLVIEDSVFYDGESPLKESENIKIATSIFKWKYPLWYSKNIELLDTTLLVTARSGIWYTDTITVKGCTIDAPKTFRRSKNIHLADTSMPYAQESLWSCSDITIENCSATGDYFGMNSERIKIDRLNLSGNYAFDGGRDIEISNSRFISKDSFWNCENVTVRDSVIIGEYIGWNSKNVRFINCYIESNQGLCYMDNVILENCKLIQTDLAFEFSTVSADITTEIDSVKNPISGKISAKGIGELIMNENLVNPEKTEIKLTK